MTWKRYIAPGFLIQKARARGFAWCLRNLPVYGLLFPFSVTFRAVLLALKPIVHIRFGRLWSYSLGVFGQSTELYLCARDAGMHPARSLDIWYHFDNSARLHLSKRKGQNIACNQQLLVMWKRVFHINQLAGILYWLNSAIKPGSNDFIVQGPHTWDSAGLLDRFPTHLALTQSEEERGLAELRKLGIGPKDPFVCIHNRDARYLEVSRPWNPEAPNNIRHLDFRNSTIQNYALAARALADLGYFVVRVGKHPEEPFLCDHPRIIDYATQCQSDFMDVFLAAHCTFYIGQNSGGTALPTAFRKPIVFVNIYPLAEVGQCQYTKGIFITKRYYSRIKGRMLTFREVLDLGLALFLTTRRGEQALATTNRLEVEVVENTPEEIKEAALEMHNRLNSKFTWGDEEQDLQDRFLAILSPLRSEHSNEPAVAVNHRLKAGTHFLKTNRQLLD